MKDCIFCKIAKGEIAKEFIYEDEEIMVFEDIRPIKPIHLLIVPKKHVVDLLDVKEDKMAGKIFRTIQKIAKDTKLDKTGYRVGVNGGGAQIINHLHVHLIGPMGKEADF